jgi:hypothetical protein
VTKDECKQVVGSLVGAFCHIVGVKAVRLVVTELAKDQMYWGALQEITQGLHDVIAKGGDITEMIEEKAEELELSGRNAQ